LPVFQAPKLPTIGESVEGPGAVSFAGGRSARDSSRRWTLKLSGNVVWSWVAGGRRNPSAHELATLVSGSFNDLSQMLPADLSDHFVGGFREGVLRVWRGA